MSPTPIITVDEHHLTSPLAGGHKPVACVSCHADNSFTPVDPSCITCHAADFGQEKVPMHRQLDESTQDCLLCHQISAWKDSVFNHSSTDFPLFGAHTETVCLACHTPPSEGEPLQFGPLATDCIGCHADDFEDADEPNHVLLDFPKDCLQCHNQNDWEPAVFDHSQFDFALNGAHQQVACSSCHVDGVYDGTPTDCISCHADEYQGVTEPVHVEASFSAQCLECHTETAWQPSFFDHDDTGFALNGAHQQTDCSSCHTNGVYDGTPTNCISCHADDEPRNHFGPDCAACHTEKAWTPSTFDHERYFPLRRGEHRIYRNDCQACHIDPSSYSFFSCIDCHDGEHQRRDMDKEHRGIGGYRYESQACYTCHPDGDD